MLQSIIDKKECKMQLADLRFKCIILTPDRSVTLQQALFQIGCEWPVSRTKISYTDFPFIYVQQELISCLTLPSGFLNLALPEVTFDQAMKLLAKIKLQTTKERPMLKVIRELKQNKHDMKIALRLSEETRTTIRSGFPGMQVLNDSCHWQPANGQMSQTAVYCLYESVKEPTQALLVEALQELVDECLQREDEDGYKLFDEDCPLITDAMKALKQAAENN